ncbi:7277_t:CDS:1, partial [Cetraspora pellucida]
KKYNALIYDKREFNYNSEWKDLEQHIKIILGLNEVTKENIIEYIKNTDEYTLLAHGRKFNNLLAKGTDLVRRNSTLICRIMLKKILYTMFDYKEY